MFQLFIDVIMALFATTVCSTTVIAQVADIVKNDDHNESHYDYMPSSFVLLATIICWFAKFFIGVAWYRCKLQTNVIKHTQSLFVIRIMADIILLLAIPIPVMIWSINIDDT